MPLEHFGKYLLIDKIGMGGMAEVYLAKQRGIKGFEKVLAIKRILPNLTQDPEFVSMFINEAKLAALLSHQNIVQIFELGHIENVYYIAMEYVKGKDLRTVLHHSKSLNHPPSIGQILLMLTKICSGLDYAHRKKDLNGDDLNLVHRDISPQNILVSYEGEVKLVDFGIAKAASQSSETRTGFIKGKLSYLSPEQAWGKPADRRSDIFSLGIILYEMLTGYKLFKGENEFSTLEKIREAKVEPVPSKLNGRVSPELEAIILKALAKEPENRFQSAAELQMVIEDHMSQKGYDFSTVRLTQYLQGLFAAEIQKDIERFRTAEGAVSSRNEDQQTVIRPASRKRPVPTRLNPTGNPQNKKRQNASRVLSSIRMILLVSTLLFLSATWMAIHDSSIVYSLRIRSAEVQIIYEALASIPDRVLDHFIKPPMAKLRSGITPTLENSPPVEQNRPIRVSYSPLSSENKSFTLQTNTDPVTLIPVKREEIQQLFKEAETLYHQKKLGQVEIKLRQIIELEPFSHNAYHLLGTVILEKKDPLQAMGIFEEASRKFPDDPTLHYDLGFLYSDHGVASMARKELQKALELDPMGFKAQKARQLLAQLQLPGNHMEAAPDAMKERTSP
jgi:serine/threonine protein kinase